MPNIVKVCEKHGECKFHLDKTNDRYRCSKCAVEAVQRRRLKLKQMSVDYKGGECLVCGYNKCLWALDFHHRDPTQKDFILSRACTRSFDRIKIELDKCDMLCSNCHRELHSIEENRQ